MDNGRNQENDEMRISKEQVLKKIGYGIKALKKETRKDCTSYGIMALQGIKRCTEHGELDCHQISCDEEMMRMRLKQIPIKNKLAEEVGGAA